MLRIICPTCGRPDVRWNAAQGEWTCGHCSARYEGTSDSDIDLSGGSQAHTSDHYSLQWGEELSFLKFIQDQDRAKAVMPAARLGWDHLFAEIRDACLRGPTTVYDAACGFGGITNELVTEQTGAHLTYIGADVHGSLPAIIDRIPAAKGCALLMRWDISKPLPVEGGFDYIVCRAAVHHTPDPSATFRALCSKLNPGGTIAISAYRRKGFCREAMDDALRGEIGSMAPEAAFQATAQFTVLGKALQQITQPVDIPEDLPLLGIPRGRYPVQSLVYYHLLKCFYNPVFGDKYSTLVNYDWYHPQYAYRYDIDELREWFDENGIELVEAQSIDVQHFLKGRRAP